MNFRIAGLSPEPFRPLFGLSEAALAARGIHRRRADARPGYPCRILLKDAAPGETLLLLNYEHHAAASPYRSSYAIYVNETAEAAAVYENEIPPALAGRTLALRAFDDAGLLLEARLAEPGAARAAIGAQFADPRAAYIHAHNAAYGCFAARIDRL